VTTAVEVRLKNGAWHLQYRNGDGKIKSTLLVRKDDVYYSATCDAIKDLAAKRLSELQGSEGKEEVSPIKQKKKIAKT
jgi:predicted molibdopterin-dependent oxidoreductase YjgC